MKKTFSRLMLFAFFAFFSFMGVTFAREMTFEELKSVLEEKDPDMNSFYMIGHYIYTDSVLLSSRDIMLASMSIDVSEENKNGKTDQDGIYQEMAIYNFEKDVQTSEWKSVAIDVLTKTQKTLKPDDVLDIQYINYDFIKDWEWHNVTIDAQNDTDVTTQRVREDKYAEKPEDPVKDGYLFVGWFVDGEKEEFDFEHTLLTEDITVKASWKYIVDTNTLLEDAITADKNDYFEAVVEEDNIQVDVGNRFVKVSDMPEESFIGAIKKLIEDPNVLSVTISYNDHDYEFKKTSGISLMILTDPDALKLSTFIADISGKPYEEATQDDLVGKEFDVTIQLVDSATSHETDVNQIEIYHVSFHSSVKKLTIKHNYEGHEDETYYINEEGKVVTDKEGSVEDFSKPSYEKNSRTGYDFLGWFIVDTEDTFDFDLSNGLEEDVVVEARWQIHKHNVTFDLGYEGASNPETQVLDYGSSIEEPSPAPERTGYDFLGWFKDEAEEAFQFETEKVPDEDVALKAHWEAQTYTVTVKDQGEETTVSVTYPAKVPSQSNKEPQEGYHFVGWFAENEEETFDFENRIITSDIKIVAKYEINKYTVTWKYDYEGDTLQTDEEVEHGTTLEAPVMEERTGYNFLGWFIDDEDSQPENDVQFNPESEQVKKDMTLVAHWEKKKYNITFKGGKAGENEVTLDGSEYEKQVIEYEGLVSKPAKDPTYEGYDFLGWYVEGVSLDDYNDDVEWIFETMMVSGDMELVAHWQIKTYNVTFDVNDYTIVEPQIVEHGSHATEPDLTLDRYELQYWYDVTDGDEDPGLSGKFDFASKAIVKDTKLKAKLHEIINIDEYMETFVLQMKMHDFFPSFVKDGRLIKLSMMPKDIGPDQEHDDHGGLDTKITSMEEANIAQGFKDLVDKEQIESITISFGDSFTQTWTSVTEKDAISNDILELFKAIVGEDEFETATLSDLVQDTTAEKRIQIKVKVADGYTTADKNNEPEYQWDFVSESIVVDNEKELKDAIANPEYSSIVLASDITIQEPIEITRTNNIFGRGHTITLADAASDKSQVFSVNGKAITVQLKNIKVTGAERGLSLYGTSTLTADALDLSGNTKCGIQVYNSAKLFGENLTYEKEDYNHPIAVKDRKNGTISILTGEDTYAYVVEEWRPRNRTVAQYTDEFFKNGDSYRDGYAVEGDPSQLKPEFQALIGKDMPVYDSADNPNQASYYLNENSTKIFIVTFRDSRFSLITQQYVCYGEYAIPPVNVAISLRSGYLTYADYTLSDGTKYKFKGYKEMYQDDSQAVSYDVLSKQPITSAQTYYSVYEKESAPGE